MKVPVPGRGYWAKKAAGHKMKVQPLPPLPPHDAKTPRVTTIHAQPPAIEAPPVPAPVAEQVAFEADPKNAIAVADALRSPHPLVRATMQALNGKGQKDSEFVSNWQSRYLDIQVTKTLLRRAFRIADALVKAFERRGWPVAIGSGDDRKTWVTVLGQRIPFGIREPIKKVLNEPAKPRRLSDGQWYTPYQSKYRDEPSGKLALVVRHSWGHAVAWSWTDTPSQLIEERLNEFVEAIVSEAHGLNEEDARYAEQERIRHEAELVRLAEQERRNAELARRGALEKQATLWEKSRLLLDYIADARQRAELQASGGELDAEVRDWLAWAEHYAHALNPLERPLVALAREQERKPQY
jgi:hypothetical protein